jgi:hypothetical protein
LEAMTANSHRQTLRRAAWVALAALLFAAPGAANAQGLFSMFGGGGPSSYEIERELAASGYELTGPLILRGDVYVADVIVRGEGPERLIVDPQSGRVMQRFRTRGDRWREAAAPPDAWADDPRGWTGPRPPADISPGPPPDDWVPPSAPTVTGPVVLEPPKTAPRKVEIKPKPTPVANVVNPPVIQSSPAVTPKPAAPALVKPAAEPSPAASATPAPSPSPSLQAVKADVPSAPVKSPASAPTPAAPAKTKSVNDIPVTPLD